MTTVAITTHPASPRCSPGDTARVNDSAVEAWAQCTASSEKTTPAAIWAANLARLFSPRLRWWRTLIQSSMNPMTPEHEHRDDHELAGAGELHGRPDVPCK